MYAAPVAINFELCTERGWVAETGGIVEGSELPAFDDDIQQLSQKRPAYYGKIRDEFERIRGRKRSDLIVATIIAPVSIAFAFWSWSRRRRVPTPDAGQTAAAASGLVNGSLRPPN